MQKCLEIIARIRETAGRGRKIVFVSGNFNVVHPGHLRLLNFAAECGDVLVVGVARDNTIGALVPENLRLEGVQAIGVVNFAVLLPCSVEEFISLLKPDMVVKGKEHEEHFNPELAAVESYGGKLLFTAGEARFSSFDLLRRELSEVNLGSIRKPPSYRKRHHIEHNDLIEMIGRFAELKVIVIGDLIVDEYITCDPLGMSQEDPTIVVTPIMRDIFVGGAGIVAAHARGLGAKAYYFGVSGDDETASFAEARLASQGVDVCLIRDANRPTTLKQRFRARDKTLLRVSHLRQHAIDHEIAEELFSKIKSAIEQADLLIFSDFNYGCLPQGLVDAISSYCVKCDVPMVADSQASSQMGDVSRFTGMHLITPTEHEARIAAQDKESGLVVLSEKLLRKAKAGHVFITLGSEGMLVHTPEINSVGLITDQLPAFNEAPKDVSGAGDCLLTCASMALVCGATIWESAYLGSIAAACQVSRMGNLPLSAQDIIQELKI
ncbi:PfkB family carbohydrate kinase [Methylomonas sp. YC3]